MANASLQTRNNAAFALTYHLVLVTKWRRKALSPRMLERFGAIASATLQDWRCELVEHGGEADHVHLLFRAHPALELSRLVNNLKTVTSRLLRKEFSAELAQHYRKPVLWHGAYYIGSVGNVSLETVRRYVEAQGQDRWPAARRAAERKRRPTLPA